MLAIYCRWCDARRENDGRCPHCDVAHDSAHCPLCARAATRTDDRMPLR